MYLLLGAWVHITHNVRAGHFSLHMGSGDRWNSGLWNKPLYPLGHLTSSKQDNFKGNAELRCKRLVHASEQSKHFHLFITTHAEFGRLRDFKILSQKEQACYCCNPACGNNLLNFNIPLPKPWLCERITSLGTLSRVEFQTGTRSWLSVIVGYIK